MKQQSNANNHFLPPSPPMFKNFWHKKSQKDKNKNKFINIPTILEYFL